MARTRLTRTAGPISAALTAWDLWRRLSPRQRRWVAKQARKHGPRIARQVWAAQRARRAR